MATVSAAEELSGLERVLQRLATTDEDKLEQVLSKLVPLIIGMLKTPHDLSRKKIMEILTHVNKRIKGQPSIKLPLKELLALSAVASPAVAPAAPSATAGTAAAPAVTAAASAPATHPMVRSFALVYLEMAVERATPQERLEAVPALLAGISQRPPQHRAICLRLAVSGLESMTAGWGAGVGAATPAATVAAAMSSQDPASASAAKTKILEKHPFLASAEDRSVFLDYAFKYVSYQPRHGGPRVNTPLAAAVAASGGPAPPAEPDVASPGLSLTDMAAIEDKGGAAPAVLAQRKAGILALLTAASPALDASEVLLLLLVAACDPSHAVSSLSEEMLKRLCAIDSAKPAVDLENEALVARMMALFHGDAEALGKDAGVAPTDRKQPASTPVRCRLMSLFVRSQAAANAFPATVLTVSECMYGAGTNARLKQQGMEFLFWVFKFAAEHQLKAIGPSMLQTLLRSLEEDTSTHVTAVALRGFAYQAIGCLAQRVPKLLGGRTDIAQLFFKAVSDEPAGLRATVAEACSALSGAFRSELLEPGQKTELEALLLSSITSHKDTVRMCAVQWANRLFPFGHGPARYICALACGDTKLEVRDEGLRGLRLLPAQKAAAAAASAAAPANGAPGGGADSAAAAEYPDLGDMLASLKELNPRLFTPDPNRSLPIPPKACLALLQFLAACKGAPSPATLAAPASGTSDAAPAPAGDSMAVDHPPVVPVDYLLFLEGALCRDASGELCAAALEALLDAAAADASGFKARYASRTPWLRSFLPHTNAAARLAAARLLGAAVAGLSGHEAEELLRGLTAMYQPSIGTAPVSSKFEEQEGGILGTGYVLAQCLTGTPLAGAATLEAAASALHQALLASTTPALLAATAAQALGLASLRGHLPLAGWAPDSAAPQQQQDGDVEMAPAEGGAVPAAASTEGGDVSMTPADGSATGAADAAAASCSSAPAAAAAAAAGPSAQLLSRVSELIGDKDVKVAVRAIAASGFLMAGHPERADLTRPLLEVLFKLSASKAEEVQFAVGEVISFAFGEVPVSVDRILLSNFGGLADEFSLLSSSSEALKAAAAESAPTAESTEQAGAAAATPAVGPEVAKNRAWMMDRLLNELVLHSKSEVRCAAAVWLVSLLTYCPRASTLLEKLGAVQEALSQLLGDPNELTQEMASRGIGLVYSRGDKATQRKLVEALVGVLQGGAKAKQAVKLTGDTKVFEEGALGVTPPSSSSAGTGGAKDAGESSNLSTYRELCSLATDLGQPDLIYKFMDLAHHNQAVNTRRGAAFGFAGIAKMAGGQLLPHVDSLIPKLYRYQYDPNQRVQDAMVLIWRALIDDTRKTVDAHFGSIIKELLSEMGGRLWRNRQAAAAGLADLLQGRRWPELAPYFQKVWSMTLRCMDDIKETVRKQAFSLARSVRGLTLRLADPQHSPAEECQKALAQLMPVLLEQGMGSTVVEIQALTLDTLSKVCKVAQPEALRPHLVPLVQAMLEALSSLEDVRLNYAEQHTERLGLDAERLESARVSASRSSPMADTLDICSRFSDAASLELLVPMLAGQVKRGVGLNTKVGTARFIRTLMTRASTDDARTHAPVLLRALTGGARAERSGTVRKAYAAAAAQVCKHASGKRVEKVVEEACGMYLESSADKDSKYVGGLLLHELLRALPDVFAANAAAVLPLAFSAKMDDDKEVAAVWKEVWEEGVSSEAGAVRLYASEIVEALVAGLGSSQWSRKKTCADAVVQLTQLGGDLLGSHAGRLAAALLAEVPGNLWDGKESMLDGLGALCTAAPLVLAEQPGYARVVDTVAAAVGRKKASYRAAALRCLTAVLTAFKTDFFDKVSGDLLSACEAHCSAPPSAASASADNSNGAGKGSADMAAAKGGDDSQAAAPPSPLPLVESVQCLVAAYCHRGDGQAAGGVDAEMQEVEGPGALTAPAVEQGARVVAALARLMHANVTWQQHQAVVQACQAVLKRGEQAKVAVLADWCSQLLPPIADYALAVKAQQARLAALACIDDMIKMVPAASLAQPALEAARKCATDIQTVDKTAVVAAAALRILGNLSASNAP